jgi:heme/copper-type cytochrome/quinol oxidase subunit 2
MDIDPVSGEQFLGYVVTFFKVYFVFILIALGIVGTVIGTVAFFVIRGIRSRRQAVDNMFKRNFGW